MGNFNRGKRDGGGFGGNNSRGGRDGGRPQMHKAVCNECGNNCEVPFRPSGDKPVYCSGCFSNQDNEGGGGRGGRRDSGRDGGRDGARSQMHDAVCAKCGDDCQVPFRPSGDKPVYCSGCFEGNDRGDRRDSGRGQKSGPSNDQFAILNSKLDKIMKALNLDSAVEVRPAKKEDKKEAKKESAKKAPAKKESAKAKKASAKKVATKKPAKAKKVVKKKKK